MTVLEKIKRCVSLVWDFQEIYGEEDIEEFCHNELSTYSQHDEILDYFKHIEALEKENAELKGIKDIATLIRANNDTVVTLMQLNNMLVSKNQQLTKAKNILSNFLNACEDYEISEARAEAAQFLSEVEK